jgi:hypothetical protein
MDVRIRTTNIVCANLVPMTLLYVRMLSRTYTSTVPASRLGLASEFDSLRWIGSTAGRAAGRVKGLLVPVVKYVPVKNRRVPLRIWHKDLLFPAYNSGSFMFVTPDLDV